MSHHIKQLEAAGPMVTRKRGKHTTAHADTHAFLPTQRPAFFRPYTSTFF